MALFIAVPGWRELHLEHLVLDLNGTLALDGELVAGVREAVAELSGLLQCHLVTADTFGTAGALFGPAVELALITPGDEGGQKLELVRRLGSDGVAALGNGANDAKMLDEAAIGICVAGPEGASVGALLAADVVVPDAQSALGLLLRPDRLRATMRR